MFVKATHLLMANKQHRQASLGGGILRWRHPDGNLLDGRLPGRVGIGRECPRAGGRFLLFSLTANLRVRTGVVDGGLACIQAAAFCATLALGCRVEASGEGLRGPSVQHAAAPLRHSRSHPFGRGSQRHASARSKGESRGDPHRELRFPKSNCAPPAPSDPGGRP